MRKKMIKYWEILIKYEKMSPVRLHPGSRVAGFESWIHFQFQLLPGNAHPESQQVMGDLVESLLCLRKTWV